MSKYRIGSRHAFAALLAAAAAGLLVAACGGGETSDGEAAAQATVAAGDAGVTEAAEATEETTAPPVEDAEPAEETASDGGSGNACEVLTQAEIREVLGSDVGQGAPSEGPAAGITLCTYESGLLVRVSPEIGDQEHEAAKSLWDEQTVSDLGDDAIYWEEQGVGSLSVVDGTVQLGIYLPGAGQDGRALATALAERALDRM